MIGADENAPSLNDFLSISSVSQSFKSKNVLQCIAPAPLSGPYPYEYEHKEEGYGLRKISCSGLSNFF